MSGSLQLKAEQPHWLWLIPATFLLCLPALLNGFPLFFTDSMDYLRSGSAIAQALAGHPGPDYGLRSAWYSLSLLPFHGNLQWVWPIVVVQAGTVAWMLRLSLRAASRPWSGPIYLLLVALLVALTPVGWVADMIMPDILTGVLILGSFWLGPGWSRLSHGERWGLALVTLWSLLSHLSHAPLLGALCLLGWLRHGLGCCRPLLALVAVAWLAQLGLNAILYPQVPANSKTNQSSSAPLLLARLLADGPALRYVQEHGQQANLALYRHRDQLRPSVEFFLWDPQGLRCTLMASDPQEWKLICQQQSQLIVATLVTYPGQQLTISLGNFVGQVATFGLTELHLHPSVASQMPGLLPTLTANFLAGRQARGQLPLEMLGHLYQGVVALSILALAAAFRRASPTWRDLCGWIVAGLLVNAAITGVLSAVASRYQARVVWLIPMLALLFWLQEGRAPRALRAFFPAQQGQRPQGPLSQSPAHGAPLQTQEE